MNNLQPSNSRLDKSGFSRGLAKHTDPKTVAQLLDDKAALDDWYHNIEKIRQKEVAGLASQAS